MFGFPSDTMSVCLSPSFEMTETKMKNLCVGDETRPFYVGYVSVASIKSALSWSINGKLYQKITAHHFKKEAKKK